ncbi:MAG: alanine racemase [Chloroflexi bacterium]|nr:alanine racemase [Chloroflexota bacterium]
MITLNDLQNATGGQAFGDTVATEFSDFAYEAQKAEPGQLFVALPRPGRTIDDLVAQAISRGALGVLCSDPPGVDSSAVSVIVVGDVVSALGQWASYVLRQWNVTLIGVAGYVGKTLTQHAVASVLRERFPVYHKPEAIPGKLGLPLALGGLDPSHQIAVLKLVPTFPAEMADMVSLLTPQAVVITNIQPGYEETAAQIDRSLFEAEQVIDRLPIDGALIANADDPVIPSLFSYSSAPLLTFGQEGLVESQADLVAYNPLYFTDRTSFDLRYGNQVLREQWTPLLARPGLTASLAAVATGLMFSMSLAETLQGLNKMQRISGHLTPMGGINDTLIIDDSSAATIGSTGAALDLLGNIDVGTNRRVFILGNLTQPSAEFAREGHERVGRRASQVSDMIVATSQLAAEAIRAARYEGTPANLTHIAFRPEDVAGIVKANTGPGDVILVSGGRGENVVRMAEQLVAAPMDRAWLEQRAIFEKSERFETSWLEVDLNAIAHNIGQVQKRVSKRVGIMAVIQANGYGHGAVAIGATALAAGASLLGVSSPREGIQLRQLGINAPIVVLGYTPPAEIADALDQNLSLTIHDTDSSKLIMQVARERQRVAPVHVHIDTGLGQLGLSREEVTPLIRRLVRSSDITIEGISTTLASADRLADSAHTREQLAAFRKQVESFQAAGVTIPFVHAATSAAIFSVPDSLFTTVRLGIAMYGLNPSAEVPLRGNYRRALSWKTRIVQIKSIPAGESVSYGSIYRTRKDEQLAVIPVGSYDGFRDSPYNWGEVLVRGQRVPIVGRVAMDQSVISVDRLEEVTVGEEVVLIGKQGNEEIRVEDVARRLGTTHYEVLANLGERIPRLLIT